MSPMIKTFVIAVCGLLGLLVVAFAQTNPPVTRTVSGQVLTSKATPAVRLEFDKAFRYAGSQSFVLYDVANAEQHFFVDADKDGRMKRFFWIQFEGYLPTNTHTYDYKLTKVVNAGGFDFIADAYPRSLKGNLGRPDSDGNRARAFLASKGFRLMGTEFMFQRLVHLVDEAKRNELMIIYVEDLSDTGLTAADLGEGGSARSRWPDLAQGLLDRTLKNMKVNKL
ncbi:MAG TPA: hypothetical protein VFU37_20610 [Pyrinomonadaceae bacterium]|nr:hypothetical protein [Pyrinomonadaceae bacterium]